MGIGLICDSSWSGMTNDMYFVMFLPFPYFLGRKIASFWPVQPPFGLNRGAMMEYEAQIRNQVECVWYVIP